MLRMPFRLAAMVALSIAVIMAVLDATRTVAASHLALTPLGASWAAVSPDTLASFETFVRDRTNPVLWDTVAAQVLNLPGFAVFAALAFILHAIGHRPRRNVGRFATGQ